MTIPSIRPGFAAGLVLAAALTATAGTAAAEPTSPLTVEGAQPIRDNLKARVGQSVTLRLVGNQNDLKGTVSAVGDNAVQISQIAGMEYFDALVRLDQIAAIIVRRADK